MKVPLVCRMTRGYAVSIGCHGTPRGDPTRRPGGVEGGISRRRAVAFCSPIVAVYDGQLLESAPILPGPLPAPAPAAPPSRTAPMALGTRRERQDHALPRNPRGRTPLVFRFQDWRLEPSPVARRTSVTSALGTSRAARPRGA